MLGKLARNANYDAHVSAAEVLIEIGRLLCESVGTEWSRKREN